MLQCALDPSMRAVADAEKNGDVETKIFICNIKKILYKYIFKKNFKILYIDSVSI